MQTQNNTKSLGLGIFICSIGALFYCYEYLLRMIPGVMEAQLRFAFGNISATSFGTLSAYYYFAYTPMQLPAGMMMDRIGPRKLLVLACFLCAIGAYLFTFTGSYSLAAVGRFLIGFGSAFAFVGVLSLAVAWLPQTLFSMVAGLVTTLGMFGAIVGQVGMSYLIETWGWQQVLWLGPIIGVVLTVIMFMFLRDAPSNHADNENRQILSSRQFFQQIMEVLLDPQIWLIGLIGCLLYLSLSVFAEVWGKSYLMMAHGLSNLEASSSVSMVFLGWAVGGPLLGLIADLNNKRITMLIVGALMAAIFISIVLYASGLSLLSINASLFLYGVFCSVEVIVFALAKDNCSQELAATVLSAANMIIMLGGAIFQPLVGKMLDFFWDGTLDHQIRVYSQADYQLVLSFLPLSLLIVAIIAFFVKER